MRETRTARRRPSLATAISIVALVFAMSGSAYAATGGTFILGKANKATSLTSLSNSKGTALALSSAGGKPPLTVNSSVQVPSLNASELGGVPATGFLTGHSLSGTLTEGNGAPIALAGGSGTVEFSCEQDGIATNPIAQFTLTSAQNGERDWWLNKDGGQFAALNDGDAVTLASSTSAPYTVVVQVAWGAGGTGNVATADLSMAVNTTANTCTYAAQTIPGP
jgi:hypothetical protein